MARRFRLWEKKRGGRRTGSPWIGSAGEACFFALLFSVGLVALTAFGTAGGTAQSWSFGDWLVGLVLGCLIFFGAAGLIYTILQIGTTAEWRKALVQRVTNIRLLADAFPLSKDFPTVPGDANLRNSPGIKLAYRLPLARSPAWWMLAAGVFSLLWNGSVSVLLVSAVRTHLEGRPDWSLTVLVIPFAIVGVAALYYLMTLLVVHSAIGPTSLEISDHPIYPGGRYRVYLTQAGRLSVKQLRILLVCEEEATYRQGTDTRTERRRVYEQVLVSCEHFEIAPGVPFEQLCELNVPRPMMHSFQSEHNSVHWRLVVQGVVDRWPSFERSFPIVVYPASTDGQNPKS